MWPCNERKIIRLLRESIELQREILKRVTPPLTKQILIRIGEDMSSASINVGQSIPASLQPLLADGTTSSGGVVSNAQWSVDDSTIATLTQNPDGTASFSGLKAGTANISASCTVTDTNGAVGSFTATATLTVSAVAPPPPLTSEVAIQFGTAS